MEAKNLAKTAVVITNVIKLNLHVDPQEVIKLILEALPEETVDNIILYLTSMGKEIGVDYEDINDLISTIQTTAIEAVSDMDWNSTWQDIAQGIYYCATIVKGFLPQPWDKVISVVLDAYVELKGESK